MKDEIESLKEELRNTQLALQMAVQMSQFKAGFLARTSHELRSPLSSLIGLHQLILSDLTESPEEEREFIQQAFQSALKLVKLIDEIVAISKTEYGTKKLEIERVRLAEIFADIYRLTYLQAANRNLRLEIVEPEPEIFLKVDRQSFQQALLMLVDTAISSIADGKIQVFARTLTQAKIVEINIDLDCPATVWSEPSNLLQQLPVATPETVKDFAKEIEFSPGMKLLLCQNLLEVMQGKLLLLDRSLEGSQEGLTRLQCSMLLADDL
jgi:signal transduction histidine kinase